MSQAGADVNAVQPSLWFVSLYPSMVLLTTWLLYLRYQDHKLSQHFKQQRVHYFTNGFINLIRAILLGFNFTDNVVKRYQLVKASGFKLGKSVELGKDSFFIVDPELLKAIMVKDFDHFVDRQKLPLTERDDMLARMLIFVEGETWKGLRTKMSPTFTTGKIRRMFGIMDVSGKRLVQYVQERLGELPDGSNEIDMQEGLSKFTLDFIAAAAFGIDSKALEQQKPSIFEQMASKMSLNIGASLIMKFIVIGCWPWLSDKLKLSIFPEDATQFFSSAIKDTLEYRRKNSAGGKRNDFIELMLEARAGQLKLEESELISQFERDQQLMKTADERDGGDAVEASVKIPLEDDDIVAQCGLFILGGFDTTQSVLIFAAYNLALHPDLQGKLYSEVKAAFEKNGGELTYDLINKMEYMDMFISESLRYFTPAPVAQRVCTKDYLLPETGLLIKKGSTIDIPAYALHRDPDLYDQPETFDPERFSPENRSKIHPYAYTPFGAGPRSCIAMRLALVEVKVAIAHLVLNFQMEPSAKTPIPMKFSKQTTLKPADGLWLKMSQRKQPLE